MAAPYKRGTKLQYAGAHYTHGPVTYVKWHGFLRSALITVRFPDGKKRVVHVDEVYAAVNLPSQKRYTEIMDTKGKALRAADVLRNLFIDDDEPLGALDADGANTPTENADGSATFEMSGLVYQPGAQPAKHRGGSYGEPLGRVVYTVTVKCDFVPFDGELASTV